MSATRAYVGSRRSARHPPSGQGALVTRRQESARPLPPPMDATRRVEAPAPALTMPEPVACPGGRLTSALAPDRGQHIERPPGDLWATSTTTGQGVETPRSRKLVPRGILDRRCGQIASGLPIGGNAPHT